MYVNPFWFGVICTIGCELLFIIIFVIVEMFRGFKDYERRNNNDGNREI